MSQEITISSSISINKSSAFYAISSPRLSANLDLSGNNLIGGDTQDIGYAASELVTWGDISGVPVAVLIYNASSTNYVELAGDSGMTGMKLKIGPLSFALFQPTSATLYAQANTAACRIQKWAA